MRKILEEQLTGFHENLIDEEKSQATIEKYMRDVCGFQIWLGEKELNKNTVLAYKAQLTEQYAPASVNSMLCSLNRFFQYCEWYDLKVRNLKIQRQVFVSDEQELTKAEYERLLNAAGKQKNERLYLLMQTICSTGIRVSELRFVTVEAVNRTYADISCKGKRRRIFLPNRLCAMLKRYIQKRKIKNGSVFVTKNGKPLDRSNIWGDMKKLCKVADVCEKRYFRITSDICLRARITVYKRIL